MLLHHADQGAEQPEARRPGPPLRSRAHRAAHRRPVDQRRCPGGDDHRGAPQTRSTRVPKRCRVLYVVMDERHSLADRMRGAVWEEVILHLPEEARLVSLSATVSNAEEFGGWIKTVRGDTTVVVDDATRPVPLRAARCRQAAVRPVRLRRLRPGRAAHRVDPEVDARDISGPEPPASRTSAGRLAAPRPGSAAGRSGPVLATVAAGRHRHPGSRGPAAGHPSSPAGRAVTVRLKQCLRSPLRLTEEDRVRIAEAIDRRCGGHLADADLAVPTTTNGARGRRAGWPPTTPRTSPMSPYRRGTVHRTDQRRVDD